MPHTMNAELIEIALKITANAAEASKLRQRASVCTDPTTSQSLEQEAYSLDDDISQLCDELRLACQSPPSAAERAIAALPDCVANAMLEHEDDVAWR